MLGHVPAGASGGAAAVHSALVRDHKLRAEKSKGEKIKKTIGARLTRCWCGGHEKKIPAFFLLVFLRYFYLNYFLLLEDSLLSRKGKEEMSRVGRNRIRGSLGQLMRDEMRQRCVCVSGSGCNYRNFGRPFQTSRTMFENIYIKYYITHWTPYPLYF